jgi:protein-tyrosine phosphatase
MRTELYWIAGPWQGKLAILPRPRGGDWLEDEVHGWSASGIDVVVSLLTGDEVTDFDLAREGSLCEAHGIDFRPFPIVDRSVPASRKATWDFVKKLAKLLEDGKSIAIHCRQGIGRSALIAASLLVLAGMAPEAAFLRVSEGRGCAVPETSEQRQWLMGFAQDKPPRFLTKNNR